MFKKVQAVALFIAVLSASISMVNAETRDYVPYTGKIKVKLQSVESIKVAHVGFETWPGFSRNIRITLPNIQTPDSHSLSRCEQVLAERALEFTTRFLTDAETISVEDMLMENSASANALSNLHTGNGSLMTALKAEGFARSSDVPAKTPWCQ